MAAHNKIKKKPQRKIKSVPKNQITDSVLSMLVKNGKAVETKKPAEQKPNLPKPPADLLDATGVAEWNRVTELLHIMGLITELDITTLMLYCDAYSDFMRAAREIKKEQFNFVKEGKTNGGNYRNLWYDIKKKAAAEMYQYSAALGLSPHHRGAIKKTFKEANNPNNPTNPFDEI